MQRDPRIPREVSIRPGKRPQNMQTTEEADDSSQECRCSPSFLWTTFCRWYRRLLEKNFAFLGQVITSHPCAIICLSLLIVGVCSVGFLKWKVENRTEKLFIPQNSEAIRDLNKADQYFRVKFREETVLLEALPEGNVLTPKCLKEALKIHREIIKLESYVDLCSTSSGESADSCLFINPLEIFDFKNTNLDNITQQIDRAYRHPALLMRNGRPLVYNFHRLFGGITKNSSSGEITGARALQMIYYMQDNSENGKVLQWEERFIEKMSSLRGNMTCGKVYYSADRSMDGAISESVKSGIVFVFISFAAIIISACTMLAKCKNPLTGHSLLACAGVLAVGLGILAGFGLAAFLGTPFVNIAGILPFLVLSIGIDEMFIIVDKIDRYKPRDVVDTIKVVMCQSGVSITMTTLTDLVAFAVSTTTSFPVIRYFCVYAAFSVTLAYLMMITFFIAFVTLDLRRMKNGYRDCFPCCQAPRSVDGALAWDEPRPKTSNKIMAAWGRILMRSGTKVVAIFLSLGLLGAGIYGATKIDGNFDQRLLIRSDSYFTEFQTVQDEYFSVPIEVSIVLSERFSYGEKDNQMEIMKLPDIVMNNEYYQNHTVSWFDIFQLFAKKSKLNIDSHENFTSALKNFLHIPSYSLFREDVKLSTDQQHIAAARIIAFMKPSKSSTFQRDAMLSLREDLSAKSELSVFPISRCFIFFEQYAAIPREIVRNLLIAAAAILVVTFPFLVSVTVALFVCLGFVALAFELLGLMYFWGVPLNAVSMINLVMAVGFSVDYSVHIAHAFVTSRQRTGNERVIEALEIMGSSVFKGGMCTYLGILVTAFAPLEIYWIFFRMFFGVVHFGLLHGLCFLPVYLSIICWQPAVVMETIPSNSYNRLEGTSAETVPMWERGIVIESDYDE